MRTLSAPSQFQVAPSSKLTAGPRTPTFISPGKANFTAPGAPASTAKCQ